MKVAPLFAFIRERHAIYERRQRGEPKPWTQDPILQAWRFCNVYRELDTVTIWIREHWRELHAEDPDVWFAMVVARLFNLPASLEVLGYPVPFAYPAYRRLGKRKKAGERVFGAAYMIHADSVDTGLKSDYLARKVLAPLWRARTAVRPQRGDTLAAFHTRLMGFRDMGSFMAAQVVADTKYTGELKKASDWWTWAAPGPGSERGLNAVYGRDFKARWKPGEWFGKLQVLQTKIDPLMREAGMPRLHAQDLQNCLCEFSKYEKVRLGEGRPKQKYNGGA